MDAWFVGSASTQAAKSAASVGFLAWAGTARLEPPFAAVLALSPKAGSGTTPNLPESSSISPSSVPIHQTASGCTAESPALVELTRPSHPLTFFSRPLSCIVFSTVSACTASSLLTVMLPCWSNIQAPCCCISTPKVAPEETSIDIRVWPVAALIFSPAAIRSSQVVRESGSTPASLR